MFFSDAIAGNLEAIFEEGDQPTDENDLQREETFAAVLAEPFEMAVPGEGHEDVGYGEEKCCSHGTEL